MPHALKISWGRLRSSGAARVRDGDVELQEALFASRKGAKRSLGRPCPGATKLGGLGGGAGLTLDQRKLGILRVPTGTRASSRASSRRSSFQLDGWLLLH